MGSCCKAQQKPVQTTEQGKQLLSTAFKNQGFVQEQVDNTQNSQLNNNQDKTITSTAVPAEVEHNADPNQIEIQIPKTLRKMVVYWNKYGLFNFQSQSSCQTSGNLFNYSNRPKEILHGPGSDDAALYDCAEILKFPDQRNQSLYDFIPIDKEIILSKDQKYTIRMLLRGGDLYCGKDEECLQSANEHINVTYYSTKFDKNDLDNFNNISQGPIVGLRLQF